MFLDQGCKAREKVISYWEDRTPLFLREGTTLQSHQGVPDLFGKDTAIGFKDLRTCKIVKFVACLSISLGVKEKLQTN